MIYTVAFIYKYSVYISIIYIYVCMNASKSEFNKKKDKKLF